MNRVIRSVLEKIKVVKRTAPSDGSDGMAAAARLTGNIKARVYRAQTGTWEDLGVISKGAK